MRPSGLAEHAHYDKFCRVQARFTKTLTYIYNIVSHSRTVLFPFCALAISRLVEQAGTNEGPRSKLSGLNRMHVHSLLHIFCFLQTSPDLKTFCEYFPMTLLYDLAHFASQSLNYSAGIAVP